MEVLVVLENPKLWALEIPGTRVVSARDYLTQPSLTELKRAKVLNFCRTYSYQSLGYYVSLLAMARGHKPLPSVKTIQALRQSAVLRIVSEDVEDLVQRLFAQHKTDRFELSIYFGRNLAKRYDRLCQTLFNHFPAPFLRAEFVRTDKWRLNGIRMIATNDIPEEHREFVAERAGRYFERPTGVTSGRLRYDLAILCDPEEEHSPSDERAIQKFIKAARQLDIDASVIGKDDFGSLAEYDALFIRTTTSVNHFTYRFAIKAEAEGMVVIDDPLSIVRCSNKVYLAEVFARHGVPGPKTLVVHRDNRDKIVEELGLPCVLKRPDSSFSQGVVRAKTAEELAAQLELLFEDSELVVAQEFTPSEYDWRIGVLGGEALFACKYFMARGHWQIQNNDGRRHGKYGKHETVALDEVPANVLKAAVKAGALMGNGLYGVDVKESDGRAIVMEVNDNPNIEAGVEDLVLKDDLYAAIMKHFYDRLERRGARGANP